MKLKNGEIIRASQALQKIEGKLPVKTSSDLAKLTIKLDEPLKVYDQVRKGLVETYQIYNEPDGEGNQLIKTKGKAEDLAKFISEMNELLALEVEIVVSKVKLPEKIAGTCDACHHNMDVPLQVETSVLIALDRFVEVG